MRLRSISVMGFRGLRDFPLEFSPDRPLLMYGMNGTGKSSLFQAIHFGVTGGLPPVSALQEVPSVVYRHRGLDEGELAAVILKFEHDGLDHIVERSIDNEGKVECTYSSPEAEKICECEYNGLCFLTRPKFAAMVESAERERWTRFSPLLGHGALAAFRAGLRTLSLNVTRGLELNRLRRDKNDSHAEFLSCSEALTRAMQAAQVPGADVDTLSRAIIALGYSAPGGRIDWEELQNQSPGAARIRELNALVPNVESEMRIIASVTLDREQTIAAVRFLREVAAHPETAHDLLHASFYEIAGRAVEHHTDEACPICGLTPADWNQVRENLTAHRQALAQLAAQQRQVSTALTSTRDALDSAARQIRHLRDSEVASAEIEAFGSALQALHDLIDLFCRRAESTPIEGVSEAEAVAVGAALEDSTAAHAATGAILLQRKTAYNSEFEALTTNTALQGLLKLRAVAEAKVALDAAFLRHRDIEAQLADTEQAANTIQEFAALVDSEESELSSDLLLDMEGEVRRIFAILTDQRALVPAIDVKVERGIRTATIDILDFHGLGRVPVREYLSEANRNVLGLAIYFAGILRRGPIFEAVVLDDVSHSADDRYRRGMAAFICNELAQGRQLFVFTHDNPWYARLSALLNEKYQGIKILDWTPDNQLFETDHGGTLLERARQRIQAGDTVGGNLLRQGMELLLDELCEAVRVPIPFKRAVESVKFETKRQRLISALKDANTNGQGVIDESHPAVRVFATSQKIANLASHQPTAADISVADIRDALKDVEEFFELFTCKNPHGRTRCGKLLTNLKKANGAMPECTRCKEPFTPMRA